MTTVIRRFVRNGAENYVQTEYPVLSNFVHADRFASQMVMNLNWELIQTKITESLTDPSASGLVREELSALETRLKDYIASDDLQLDIDSIKEQYTESIMSALQSQLTLRLPALLEYAVDQDSVWQVFESEILPSVRSFLQHQIKRNQAEIIAGLDLSGRIEKAVLAQKPEEVHALINRVSGEHLVALQLLGFLLGGIAGLLLIFAK